MQTYREFAPTQFDASGLNGDRLGITDWFVAPVTQTRDSDILTESNFATFLRELGGESDTVQVHRFGHWGVGWFEVIVIDPADVASVQCAEEMESALEDYPVLDDEDHSSREYEQAAETWEFMSVRDRVCWLHEHRQCYVSIFAARRAELPQGLNSIYELAR